MSYKMFHRYRVYDDGRIYSEITNKFLSGEITKFGYLQTCLYINGKPKRFKNHRLVAMLFLETPSNYEELCINHIDGNKLNNKFSNLEWCTYKENNEHARRTGLNNISKSNSDRWKNDDFRKKTSEKMSESVKGLYVGSKNPNFKYLILDNNGNELNPTMLSEMLNLSYSYTNKLIKDCVNGKTVECFKKHNIKIINTKNKSESTN